MSATAYIVPNSVLASSPPKAEWHAHGIPADPTQSLLVVQWDDLNAEAEFESRAGVLPLGAPWEPLPAQAAPLLASFQDTLTVTTTGAVAALPPSATPDITVTVGSALRNVPWLGARMV